MIKKIRKTLITINKSPLLLKTPSPSVHQKFSLNSPAGIPSDAIIFAPENLLIQARLALKFRDTRMDLAKIHRLSAVEKIHRRDRSCFRRPNELLSPLKQRGGGGMGLTADRVGRHLSPQTTSPPPPPPLFRRWHFRLRGTSNEKPHAQCRVKRQTGLFAYHRGG